MGIAERTDPYTGFVFKVEVEGLLVGGFSEVSGLQAEVETETYREGGENEYVHKLVKGTTYPNLVLKRGITDSDLLWRWHRNVVNGKIERRNCRIILLDCQGNEKWHWLCQDAFPVKWNGPDFKADTSSVAIETLELVHNGIQKG